LNFDHFLDAIRKHVQNEKKINIDYRTSNEYCANVQQHYFWKKVDQKKEYFIANAFFLKENLNITCWGKFITF
jgi:hypothetical protein